MASYRCIVGSRHVDGALTVRPTDTSVFNGQSATLRCSTSQGDSDSIWWKRSEAGGKVESIAIGCSVMPLPSSRYSVIKDATGQCDLFIRRVDSSVAGNYTCFDFDVGINEATAYLTVIGECRSVL